MIRKVLLSLVVLFITFQSYGVSSSGVPSNMGVAAALCSNLTLLVQEFNSALAEWRGRCQASSVLNFVRSMEVGISDVLVCKGSNNDVFTMKFEVDKFTFSMQKDSKPCFELRISASQVDLESNGQILWGYDAYGRVTVRGLSCNLNPSDFMRFNELIDLPYFNYDSMNGHVVLGYLRARSQLLPVVSCQGVYPNP